MSSEESSVYLYSKENNQLYHQVLIDIDKKDCQFSRNIYALLDSEETEISDNLSVHMTNCQDCQDVLALNRSINSKLGELIPNRKLDNYLNMNENLKLVIQNTPFTKKKILISVIKKTFNQIIATCNDFLSVVFSVKMAFVYLVSIGFLLLVNWIQS